RVSWPKKALQEDGNEAVGAKVRITEGAIGYVDLGTARKAQMKTARLLNRKGRAIEGNPHNATLALQAVKDPATTHASVPDPEGEDDYPIVGFTYLMLYRNYDNPAKRKALKALVEWCLTEGQNECTQLGYVRLAPNVADEALRAVRALGD